MSQLKETNYEQNDNNEQTNDNYEEMDLKIMSFIKMMNNKDSMVIPDPTYFTISTQSAMCNISNVKSIDLSKIVVYIGKSIIKNIIFKEDLTYLIRGIVVDNLIIRFDESYLKKYKKPMIKYMGKNIDYTNKEECFLMLNNIDILENNSLKKQGRQNKKKDNEYFYNSCSIIVKADKDTKCVNIKLFNNGKITLTGSKNEFDGYHSCKVLLEEMKKYPPIFDEIEEDTTVEQMDILNYKITMINSDFNTNFKIDLLKLLTLLNSNNKDIFTKFNPEKYRGLIIGFYWNTFHKWQNGVCKCTGKCNGKGKGMGDNDCKKITISIFKSGSIIITGGRLVKQIEDAYSFINNILKENYKDIVKISILDFMESDDEDSIEDEEEEEVKVIKSKKTKKENDVLIIDTSVKQKIKINKAK